jgi:hypothetical protein
MVHLVAGGGTSRGVSPVDRSVHGDRGSCFMLRRGVAHAEMGSARDRPSRLEFKSDLALVSSVGIYSPKKSSRR